MNENLKKLMAISRLFRFIVLSGSVVMLFFLVYEYVINDELRRASSSLFYELWGNKDADRTVLLALQFPRLVTLFVGFYWLQSLLGHFQYGRFFGDEAMRCYLWLIWLKLADIGLKVAQEFATALYHQQFFVKTNIEINVDFTNIAMFSLMLVIIHLLKAAKEIDAENKEFV